MKLIVASEPCGRCGCFAFENDPDEGLRCILCARPLVQPDQRALRLVRDAAADIASTVRRERRFMESQVAAGKRAWV